MYLLLGGYVSSWLLFFDIIWIFVFGWWMVLFVFVGVVICFCFVVVFSGWEYGCVLWGLVGYLFYFFGKFVCLE